MLKKSYLRLLLLAITLLTAQILFDDGERTGGPSPSPSLDTHLALD